MCGVCSGDLILGRLRVANSIEGKVSSAHTNVKPVEVDYGSKSPDDNSVNSNYSSRPNSRSGFTGSYSLSSGGVTSNDENYSSRMTTTVTPVNYSRGDSKPYASGESDDYSGVRMIKVDYGSN